MRSIFACTDYREYLQQRIRALPRAGRGELQKMARAAAIHPSVMSQVFNGQRELSPEQALGIAEHFELKELESRYLVLLVQHARAGSPALRALLAKDIELVRAEQAQLVRRLPVTKILSPELQAVFYSNWYFSAIRVVSSLPGLQGVPAIAARLGLPTHLVEQTARFLLTSGLCAKANNDGIKPAPRSTHLPAGSPWIARHHANWRIKAMERHPALSARKELAYTSTFSLSRSDALKIRERLATLIEEVCSITDPSEAETAYCMNLDWFEL